MEQDTGCVQAGSVQITLNITGGTFKNSNHATCTHSSCLSATYTITGGTFNCSGQITYMNVGNFRWRPSAISGSYYSPYAAGGVTQI